MTLAAGTRLGPYVILAPLGAAWVRCTRATHGWSAPSPFKILTAHLSSDPGAQTVLRALVPDKSGGLNGSTQHWAEIHLQGPQ